MEYLKYLFYLSLVIGALSEYSIAKTTAQFQGAFHKFSSWYEKIEVPDFYILKAEIFINLETDSLNSDEYPLPSPKSFIGLNMNPEVLYDYQVNFANFSGSLFIDSLPPCKFFIIKIEGGLTENFKITPSYSPSKWRYLIKVNFFHCPTRTFVSNNFQSCSIPVTNSKIDGRIVTRLINVPEFCKKLVIFGKNLTVSRDFFSFEDSLEELIEIDYPKVGKYFVKGFEKISYENEVAREENGMVFMNGSLVIEVGYLDLNKEVEIKGEEKSVLVLRVNEDDIKYTFDIFMDYGGECRKAYQNLEKEAGEYYLRLGTTLVFIEKNHFKIRIVKKMTNPAICQSGNVKLVNNLVYQCKCLTHFTGKFCNVTDKSDFSYYTGLVFLTSSNLAMIPALLLGYTQELYAETVLLFGNMLASIIYHFCDYNFYCFTFSYSFLHDLDFILSYFSVLLSIVFLIRIQNPSIKLFTFSVLFLFLLFIGTGEGFGSFYTDIFPSIFFGALAVVKWISIVAKLSMRNKNTFWNWEECRWFFFESRNFRMFWVASGLASFVTALVIRFCISSNSFYWLAHSLWHIFIMYCPFCCFMSFSPGSSDFCLERAESQEKLLISEA